MNFRFHRGRVSAVFLFVILVLPNVIFSANILFYFAGANISMKTGVWPWVIELAKRGHNVTFFSPHVKAPVVHPNITDLSSDTLLKLVGSVYLVDRFKDRDNGMEKSFDYIQISSDSCREIVNQRNLDPAFSSLLTDTKFDLVVVNAIFGECGFYVAHYFKAKVITYHSCALYSWYYDSYGVSSESAWTPDVIFTSKTIPMTLLERAYNVLIEYYWMWNHRSLSGVMEEIMEPVLGVGNTPPLSELENNVSFVFVNDHPSIDFAKSLPPLFIDVGGMASKASDKEMPKNFKDFMDSAGQDGVILITFGSTVLLNKVTSRYQSMFFHLIQEYPNVKFLMRWSGPMPKFLDSQPENLMVSDWLPQKEILAHPKLKLFITHGGASSIQEATYNGVPIIVIPLFADQDYNAYRVEAQEVGLRVEIREMTENSLVDVVGKVLGNDKYKRNMMKKSAIFRDRPMKPVETAVFWTEFVLRHDDTISTFRPYNQHLNWFQRHLLDVFLLYGVAIIVALKILKIIIHYIVSVLLRDGSPEEIKYKKFD